MEKCLVILAKTPGISPFKTRLSNSIGVKNTLVFYEELRDCLLEFHSLANTAVYIATAEEEGMKDQFWTRFNTFHAEGVNLGEKQHFVFNSFLEKYRDVVLIGLDIPQINCQLIDQAFESLRHSDYVIGPSTDGGFYLFGTKNKVAWYTWNKTPWGNSQTMKIFLSLLDSIPEFLPSLTDLDTLEDFDKVVKEMPKNLSTSQKKIVRLLKNFC